MTDTPARVTDAMIEAGVRAMCETLGPFRVQARAIYLAMQAAKPVDALVDTLVDTPAKPVVDSEERERRLKWADARLAEVAARSVDSEVVDVLRGLVKWTDEHFDYPELINPWCRAAALLAKLEPDEGEPALRSSYGNTPLIHRDRR